MTKWVNKDVRVYVIGHSLKTPSNYPRVHPCVWWTNEILQDGLKRKKKEKMQVRGVRMRRKGGGDVLTWQFWSADTVSLPGTRSAFLWWCRRIAVWKKKHSTTSKQSPLNSKTVDFLLLLKQVTICPEDAECCSVWTNPLHAKAANGTRHVLKSHPTHFMMVLKSSEGMPLSGSDRRLMMSGSRL